MGLREFEADVALLHDAGTSEKARPAGDEDGLGIAVAERFKLAEPAHEDGRNAIERQFRMNVQGVLGPASGEMLVRVEVQAALEFRQRVRGHGESDGEGVTAEAREEICAGFNGVEKLEAVDGATRAVGDAILNADDDGWLCGAFNDARGEDADDAAMPSVAFDDEKAATSEVGAGGKADLDGGERGSFGIATLAVEALEFGGKHGGACRIAGCEEFDDLGGNVHAAGGIDARCETEGDIEAGELFGGGIESGDGEEGAESGANGGTQLAEAEGGDDPVLAFERYGVGDGGDGGHFEKAGEDFVAQADRIMAGENGLRKLERNGCAAERFFRIGAVGLVGIEDGECVGDGVVRLAEVMVGDDEVETEAASGLGFGECAHSGVNGDDESYAFGMGGFEHAGLQTIPLAQAVRYMKAGRASEHLDGGL